MPVAPALPEKSTHRARPRLGQLHCGGPSRGRRSPESSPNQRSSGGGAGRPGKAESAEATVSRRMDRQHGPAARLGELCSAPCDTTLVSHPSPCSGQAMGGCSIIMLFNTPHDLHSTRTESFFQGWKTWIDLVWVDFWVCPGVHG